MRRNLFLIAVGAEFLECIKNDPLEHAPSLERKEGGERGGREGTMDHICCSYH